MEFLEGENLEQVLERRKRVEVGDAIGWALQTCLALAEAHAMGIVHRDIKPENLFLAETPEGDIVLKVLDFGASAFVATRWQIGEMSEMHVGTPLYMSPERIRDASSSDLRSDIWALGAVVYELLVGVAPFDREGAEVKEIVERTLTIDPEPLHALHPGVSPQLSRAIGRCLEKSPKKRFQSVADLARALATSGRPGAHGIAMRVARILDRASKEAGAPRPVAESAVPRPRPPLPSAPVPLTAPSSRPSFASEPLLLTSRIEEGEE
jgi:serine/threonine-protein kinase